MKKNKTSRIALIINLTLSILLFIILLNFSIHVIRTKRFNNQIHSLSNGEISKEINVYGRMTGEWPKEDALVPGVTNGGTYEYTTLIANKLNMPKKEVQYAYYAAVLHDVGKCYVPDEILKKPGRLTDEEFDTIKKHTTFGGEMLKSIKTIKYISDGAKYHHERYDGKGYPEGLSGENIPFIGRIICVADAFDAMTSSRCYRPALAKDYVINEIRNNLGKQFDPSAGQAMLDLLEENKINVEGW